MLEGELYNFCALYNNFYLGLRKKMSYGEAFCVNFANRLIVSFMDRYYTCRDLACIASYFWSKLNDEYKEKCKVAAAEHSHNENLTGKKKIRGFWYFALCLEGYMLNQETGYFYELWHNMKAEHQMMWSLPLEHVIIRELDKVYNGEYNHME